MVIFAIILFSILGLYVLIGRGIIGMIRSNQCIEEATASIIDIQTRGSSRIEDMEKDITMFLKKRYYPVVEYVINNQTYTAKSMYPTYLSKHKINENVMIKYNPKRKKDIYIIGDNKISHYMYNVIFGIVWLGFTIGIALIEYSK